MTIHQQIKPVPLRLYQTMDSIPDSVAYAKSLIPEEYWPDLVTALMVHHNTILSELKKTNEDNLH